MNSPSAVPIRYLGANRLNENNPSGQTATTRRELEESKLFAMMQETCGAINKEAGRLIVEVQHYMAPQPVLTSFLVSRGHTEYLMRLELQRGQPSLVFFTQRWRTNLVGRLLRFCLPFLGLIAVQRRFSCKLSVEAVTKQEVEAWFAYLLSGLRRAQLPRIRDHSI
jgi:hypothetical protein